jgi:hypothetical protein
MRRFAPALFSLAAACAAQPPLPKYEEDRLHCQALMYYQRVGVGRSAPNWNFYEQCMRARGSAR